MEESKDRPTKFKRYPQYKDSGVEWLREIPAHWDIFPLRRKLVLRPDGIKIGPFGSQLKLEYMTNSGYKVYGQENVIADIKCDKYIIMPNHFHATIQNVGTDLCVCPNGNRGGPTMGKNVRGKRVAGVYVTGEHIGSPHVVQNDDHKRIHPRRQTTRLAPVSQKIMANKMALFAISHHMGKNALKARMRLQFAGRGVFFS